MSIGRLLVELACAGTLAPQTFIHVADPQFGMLTKNASFEHKAVNLEFAIVSANRLKLPPRGRFTHGVKRNVINSYR